LLGLISIVVYGLNGSREGTLGFSFYLSVAAVGAYMMDTLLAFCLFRKTYYEPQVHKV
jgi:hypothetical protein